MTSPVPTLYVRRSDGMYTVASNTAIKVAYRALVDKPARAVWTDWGYCDNGHCPFTLGQGKAFCSLPYGHKGDHKP